MRNHGGVHISSIDLLSTKIGAFSWHASIVDLASQVIPFDPNRYPQRTLTECTNTTTFPVGSSLDHCWVHVSMISLIAILPTGTSLTHQVLLEALIEGEYRSSIDFDAGIVDWGNEAVARQFYTDCGIDGCQGDELYSFLDYFQSPLADTLDDDYRQVLRIKQDEQPYWQRLEEQLLEAVSTVLTSEDPTWRDGAVNGQPYGYGTRGLVTPVNVSDQQVASFAQLCGFAARTISNGANPPFGQMFVGTPPETDPAFGGPCSFQN